jgi:hypothetical protein
MTNWKPEELHDELEWNGSNSKRRQLILIHMMVKVTEPNQLHSTRADSHNHSIHLQGEILATTPA